MAMCWLTSNTVNFHAHLAATISNIPKMNQNLFILTFLLFLANQHFVAAVDQYYIDCSVAASTCSDNQTIRFPFYLRNQQKPYCGYPGFEVSCDEFGHSILNLSINDPYIVRQISYENRSLIVSNAAISHDPTPNCIPALQNISFPNERFELPKQNQVFLLGNCHPPRVPEKCGDGKVVVVPVKDYDSGDDESVGMRQVLSRGFDLTWKTDDCSSCQRSGGLQELGLQL
ncbi:LEAF RUST 10 DISEASE-RESISTANCE LOCUS RECEPTOR-LIKE PROTEIN KINASE-like 1.2 [Ziziphus jujuba]|uniref:non-specific serine/threonine protein kinase n=1 Tax=Ziziphus jujuba TaxID=326968 RepID=A0ABM3I0C5_ZIZJJ|nr:LEAF RUST 10 DISEASE-RESISTANCE LOCUS RECEPTOR-LIKE PROTEIN KINASE-like 1.2 [Ziziphus jujuba]